MNSDLISVIIPVYNAEQFLERAVRSVLDNTYSNLEIILVDDGSPDRSGEICDRLAGQDSRIKVIHQKNQGTAAARNAALAVAKGRYIAFADNDDFIHREFYECMLTAMEQTDADVVVCELTRDMPLEQFEKQDGKAVVAQKVDKVTFIEDTYEKDWTRNTAPWNKLYKRELFDEVRFPVGKGYEDAYTTWRLIWQANTIAHLNVPLYYWYQNEESYSSKKNNPRKLFFREEAIREQAVFYTARRAEGYAKAAENAQYFYMKQIQLMVWDLQTGYVDSEETTKVYKQMRTALRRWFRKYHRLCRTKKEWFQCLEAAHPHTGGFLRARLCK